MKRLLAASFLLLCAGISHAQNGVFAVNSTTATDVYLIPQSGVNGNVLFVPWNTIETSSGVYNYSTIEAAIGAPICNGSNPTTCFGAGNTTACKTAAPNTGNPTWGCQGKKTALVIWPVSDGSLNTATPQWWWTLLNPVNAGCSAAGTCGKCADGITLCGLACANGNNIPNYQTAFFQTYYTRFLSAILTQYGNDPRIAYIRTGIGNGGESSPACLTAQESTYGLTESLWKTYAEVVLATEAAHEGTVPMQIGLSCYAHPCTSDASLYDLPDSLAAYGIPLGLNIGHEELSAADLNTYWRGVGSASTCDADFCGLFEGIPVAGPLDGTTTQKYHTAFKNEQFNAATCPDPNNQSGNSITGKPCQGSPITLLPFIASLHVSTMEIVARSDLTIAYGITSGGSSCAAVCYPGGIGSCSSTAPYCPFTPAYQTAINYFVNSSVNSRNIGLPTVNRP